MTVAIMTFPHLLSWGVSKVADQILIWSHESNMSSLTQSLRATENTFVMFVS